jgi:hypothetical protein
LEKPKINNREDDCLVLVETTRQVLSLYKDNEVIIDQLMDIAAHLEKQKKGAMAYWIYEACDNLEGMDCILTGQS